MIKVTEFFVSTSNTLIPISLQPEWCKPAILQTKIICYNRIQSLNINGLSGAAKIHQLDNQMLRQKLNSFSMATLN